MSEIIPQIPDIVNQILFVVLALLAGAVIGWLMVED